MKIDEQKKAIMMRKQGIAMGKIAQEVGVAKSTISVWVRNVSLTKTQIKKLTENSHSFVAIENRRRSRMFNNEVRKDKIRELAYSSAKKLINNPLWCVGVALYWGEGGKTQSTARIANSDPKVIETMMRFFKIICDIPEEKFRAHIHVFSHSEIDKVETYWSKVSGIKRNQFYKTYKKNSSASLEKRQTLPNGTVHIYIHDSNFFVTIMAWVEYLKDKKHL